MKFVISTDAHSAAELDNMHFGVATAQRGWAESEHVINTWPWKRFKAFVDAKRERGAEAQAADSSSANEVPS